MSELNPKEQENHAAINLTFEVLSSREKERNTLFPQLKSVHPVDIRQRGLSDEAIAHVLNCPVEDITRCADFDEETVSIVTVLSNNIVGFKGNINVDNLVHGPHSVGKN